MTLTIVYNEGSDTNFNLNTNINTAAKGVSIHELMAQPNVSLLEDIISDSKTVWHIHNCKITEQYLSLDDPLAFIYHYDALPEDIKLQHPLTKDLLSSFQQPMRAEQAANLLGISADLIQKPWHVKVTGTLVMFCDEHQLALRLKFTNTAKPRDAVYAKTKQDALKLSMQSWHFFGEVFLLNKHDAPLIMTLDDEWLHLSKSANYQALPSAYAIATLALLEQQKPYIPVLDEAVKARLL